MGWVGSYLCYIAFGHIINVINRKIYGSTENGFEGR